MAWHERSVDEVFDALETGPEGLSEAEARERLERHGPNEIREEAGPSMLRLFLDQFRDVLIYLLLFAALISLAVGLFPGHEPEYADATLIVAILLGNGIFGFVQDYRAEQSIAALKELSTPDAMVIRDGERREVDSTMVVPGDIIVVEGGDAVPADARVIEASSLETDESALTGESSQVTKGTDTVAGEAPLAERSNSLYMNTTAVRGRGKAVVTDTGMDTAVGGIAEQIAQTEEGQTPFQEEVDHLGKTIGAGVVGIIVLVAIVQGLFTNASYLAILLVAITLAVAAVPEGLPAVVTLTLALGSRRMLRKNALVRRLPVVESLGAVDVILTDKTGTLTEDRMTVTRILSGDATYDVGGEGTDADSMFQHDDDHGDLDDPADLEALEPVLKCGTVCNNVERAPEDDDRDFFGDPTEIALEEAARKAGIQPDSERVHEIPFSSARKRMTAVTANGMAYMKGAPEEIIDRCDRILVDGSVEELTPERREAVLDTNEAFASDALRVLGFAHKDGVDPDEDPDVIEEGMVFLGLQGMIDPPRSEVPDAVAECRDAGIRVVMITGDNLATAKAIGKQIGFDPEGAMTGSDIEDLTEGELAAAFEETDVFARMSPEHKVRILEAAIDSGHSVAMTGDGVNDAPALKRADVGVSMGERGTDVAQQASDMVLRDDNFATIRDAIAEGRGIFDNIRKFVNFLLSANAGEVLVVFFGVILGSLLFPSSFGASTQALILTPAMLLWINLVTDGFPALALGVDSKAEDIMDRQPRGIGTPVINTRVLASIGTIGSLLAITGLPLFFYGLTQTGDIVVAQTVLFTFIVAAEMVWVQLIRSRYDLSPFSNPWLVASILGAIASQLAVLYTPLNAWFGVVPLGVEEWIWIGVAFLGFTALGAVAGKALTWVFAEYLDGD